MAIEKVSAPILFDVRCSKRNLEKGLLDSENYQKYLDSLPDCADKASLIQVDQAAEIAEKEARRKELGIVTKPETRAEIPVEAPREDAAYFEEEE